MLLGTLSKRGRQRQRWEARKICLRNPRILQAYFSLVTTYFSIFAEITLSPASASERNDGL